MRCRAARGVILEMVRGAASEADRLCLEDHLGGCEPCRVERGRWALVEQLREQPVRHLPAQARARMLQKLIAEAPRPVAPSSFPARARVKPTWALAGMAAAAALAALTIEVAQRRHPGAPVLVVDGSSYGQVVRGDVAGSVRLPGAQVWYARGASLKVAGARRIDLVRSGEGGLEVEVAPGGPGRFRVCGPRFIVEVVGTRFVVRDDGMRTLHGAVRVLDLDEHELAVVRAGETWKAPETLLARSQPGGAAAGGGATSSGVSAPGGAAPPAAPAPEMAGPPAVSAPAPLLLPASSVTRIEGTAAARIHASDGNARAAARDSVVRGSDEQTERQWTPERKRVSRLLTEAKRALADERFAVARARVHEALALHGSLRQHADADMIMGDALRLEGRSDDAVRQYRHVAERWRGYPEGEAADFFRAQLACERGPTGEARAQLSAFLARYPSGTYAHEAIERLAELHAEPAPAPATASEDRP